MPNLIINNRRTISLQTAEGNDIPNEQYFEIDESEWSKIGSFETKYGASIVRRTDPTGIYNCHDLTFASRRTSLYENNFLTTILKDDGYIEVQASDALGGDVILYFEDFGVTHSGLVIESTANSLVKIPKVCSKWGHNAEYIHFANMSPYGQEYKFYRVRKK